MKDRDHIFPLPNFCFMEEKNLLLKHLFWTQWLLFYCLYLHVIDSYNAV